MWVGVRSRSADECNCLIKHHLPLSCKLREGSTNSREPLLQLLSAVAYLHDRWVMHRDLKLSNLLFTHSGEGCSGLLA